MTREEAIQRIVWCVLRHADQPDAAVATARLLHSLLGKGQERQMAFTNILRAAGLFAKDDDGYFMRFRDTDVPVDRSLLNPPTSNYLLTFPLPTEPRMRIAYSIFTGLLLKYLYQNYDAVPTEVREGMARLVVSELLPDDNTIWDEFKQSAFVARALAEGFEATLGAIGGIGGIEITDDMADSALLRAFLTVLPQYSNKFQAQGGMRINFWFSKDVNNWLGQQGDGSDSNGSVPDLWMQSWKQDGSPREVAKRIAVRMIRDLDASRPLRTQTFRNLWKGEGSGPNRKLGRRDELSMPARDDEQGKKRARAVDDHVLDLLRVLDTKRRGTQVMHEWVKSKLNTPKFLGFIKDIVAATQSVTASRKLVTLDGTTFVESTATSFQEEAKIPSLRKEEAKHEQEVKSAIQQTIGLCVATQLALLLAEESPVSIFGWRVSTLLRVPASQEWALRFLKKNKPKGVKRIVAVKPFGDIGIVAVRSPQMRHAPFQCFPLNGVASSALPHSLNSEKRCIVCGSDIDLLEGAKSFLPEAKKRHYETPTRNDSPSLCSNCAFIAYLSSVYPSSDLSVVEFPADNFLELFALYESLQGVSALVALKYINRVSSMSVLPNRYLLLSHRDGKGRMDAKAQVYLQLREQTHLLEYVDRPMRVQIEGGIPQMWSEILPHIPIGLSHFKELPSYYETKDSQRKGFAYECVRALQIGQPYKALYVAAKHAEDNQHPFERRVFTGSLKAFEEFVLKQSQALAKSLGGESVSHEIYREIADFSDYLFDLLHPLVRREAQKSGSSVSGIARKYTDLILREFGEGMAGKFLYTICQEADAAERNGDGWLKHSTFTKLYGGTPDTRGKSDEEKATAWDEFRGTHPVQLEVSLLEYRSKHGIQHVIWQKFLREVQARTLALLMLNVRRS